MHSAGEISMASKFRRGARAYTQNGRSYVVDEVDDGVVYCLTESGAETEFAESSLMTEAEWHAKPSHKTGLLYERLKQARVYTAATPKLDPVAATEVLVKIERLRPGMLDFVAFTVAARSLTDAGDGGLVDQLSIVKCREIFESAKPELRASLLASIFGTPPDVLVGAGRLGENLMRAMIEKGMTAHETDFTIFSGRRRN
jgi:hypothetical protein